MYSRIMKIILPLVALLACQPALAAETFEAGKHYSVISETPSATPSVMEFFSYGCGACFSFDPYMKHVKTALGDKAEVEYIDRKSTRLNSSHVKISYAVFCLKKKT